MPSRNGTGPYGQGPVTGRGFGPCARGLKRGFARGGRGFRRGGVSVDLSPADEKKILEAELAEIDTEKEEIKKRLSEMNA